MQARMRSSGFKSEARMKVDGGGGGWRWIEVDGGGPGKTKRKSPMSRGSYLARLVTETSERSSSVQSNAPRPATYIHKYE